MRADQSELADKLGILKRIAPTKGPAEEIKGVLYRSGYLTANNLEMALRIGLECESGQEEAFLLTQKAVEAVAGMKDAETVEIEADKKHTLNIVGRNQKVSINSINPEAFPEMPAIPEENNWDCVAGEDFAEGLKYILYAIPDVSTKMALTGVLVESDRGTINLVATDGLRASWWRMPGDGHYKMVIPKNTARMIAGLKPKGRMEILAGRASYGEGAWIDVNGMELYTRLIEGDYPDYRQFFKEGPVEISLPRKKVAEAVDMAMIVCDKNKAKVLLKFSGETLEISSKTQLGEFRQWIDLYESVEDFEIAFNGKWLLDLLYSHQEQRLQCWFSGPGGPMVAGEGPLKSVLLPVVA